ncbi:MAG: hypothetical protein KGP28_05090 [Bdellovibrionales bacterium]|nr:hypothetical protein [Bdellovibrionales bacterium]
MKKHLLFIIGVLTGVQAHAAPLCEAVKRGEGSSIERGIKVLTDNGSLEEYVWFGSDTNSRDRAQNDCTYVLATTYCQRTTPKVRDQYQNVGDPGFGPPLYVKKSSEAGILHVSNSQYQGYQGQYHAFFSACEETRAKLALRSVEAVQYQVRKRKCIADGYPEWACPGLFY